MPNDANARPARGKPYRIVQWATGTVGASSLRALIGHPDMALVGVYVYSAAKEGRDAGELCGLPAVGVRATRDIEAILALKPDCVVYMPESSNFEDLRRLLEAGINVVTTRAEFFNPAKLDPAIREPIEAACRRGASSIHSTGSSPGFITEALPIVLASIQRRLDLLMVDEFANCVGVCSDEMLFTFMGFGDTPEAFSQRRLGERDVCFEHSLSLIADAFGLPLDGFTVTSEFATARQATPVGERIVEAGQVAGQRVVTTGLRKGKPLFQFRSNWFVTTDLEPAWDLRSDGWRVLVQGDAPLEVTIGFPVKPEDRATALPGLTAHRPVNAIPYVCAARPGIVSTIELGQVIARLE